MVRTASAAGKLFLVKQTFGSRERLVQFVGVSDTIAHSAFVRQYIGSDFYRTAIPLSSLIEVDQEAAKAIWLIQTGEEL
jgi:putative alpha-1,2-mannosidase